MTARDSFAPARAAFSGIAMPVAVVGSTNEVHRSWATCTVMYVSFVPPQICVALLPGSRTLELARASGELSVSLLAADQQDVAMKAGRRHRRNAPVLSDAETVAGPVGFATPGVAGALAVLWCHIAREIPTEDHILVIATVEADSGEPSDDGQAALIRFQRRYHALGTAISEPSPEGYPI